jgi:hypothetical protein
MARAVPQAGKGLGEHDLVIRKLASHRRNQKGFTSYRKAGKSC